MPAKNALRVLNFLIAESVKKKQKAFFFQILSSEKYQTDGTGFWEGGRKLTLYSSGFLLSSHFGVFFIIYNLFTLTVDCF